MMKMSIRMALAALAAFTALAVGGPVLSASAASFPGFALPGYSGSFGTPFFGGLPSGGLPSGGLGSGGLGSGGLPFGGNTTGNNIGVPGACSTASPFDGQGRVGGINNQVCMGAGLSFVGPAIGQVASVIGPTIIGPAVVGISVVSAGNVTIGR
jgi:hypothetical protein